MAARITVQRITEVISRRRKTFAFEGVGAGAAASDIAEKLAGAAAVANSQLLQGSLRRPNLNPAHNRNR
jgi:hypothetical protein